MFQKRVICCAAVAGTERTGVEVERRIILQRAPAPFAVTAQHVTAKCDPTFSSGAVPGGASLRSSWRDFRAAAGAGRLLPGGTGGFGRILGARRAGLSRIKRFESIHCAASTTVLARLGRPQIARDNYRYQEYSCQSEFAHAVGPTAEHARRCAVRSMYPVEIKDFSGSRSPRRSLAAGCRSHVDRQLLLAIATL